jgi:hypothetical protein
MDLRQTILAEHSKANCNKIVKWVGNSQKRFSELFNFFLDSEYRFNQRAAWHLSYCVIDHPELISPHLAKLVRNLHKRSIHDSIKRNTVRLLQHIDIPKRFHGEVMDICLRYISSPDEPAVVKTFSLSILQNLSQQYPDIKNEVKLIIEERWPMKQPLSTARAKKFMKT